MSEVNNSVTNTSNTSSTTASTKSTLSSDKTTTNSNASLGKEAFLQLLVTQMKYQDPLNPQSDTAYVAQLATFSQLEQMQNLNSSFTNSQAFSLVGKEVIMTTTSASGNLGYVNGKVDFVSMINGEPFLSIDDKLYPASQLDSVVSSEYADELEKDAATSAASSNTTTGSSNTATGSTNTAANSTSSTDTAASSSTETSTDSDGTGSTNSTSTVESSSEETV